MKVIGNFHKTEIIKRPIELTLFLLLLRGS